MMPEETPTMKAIREQADPKRLYDNLRREMNEAMDAYFRGNIPELSSNKPLPQLTRDSVAIIRRQQAELKEIQERNAKEYEAAMAYQRDLQQRLARAEQQRAETQKLLVELKQEEAYPIREPHRLGLPDMPELVRDLPDLPDSFINACLASLDRFAEGYAEYGPGSADTLGLAGQWGDLHRKVMKLKRSLWNGEGDEYLTRETTEEILQDIIGHSLLALEMLSRGFEGGKS